MDSKPQSVKHSAAWAITGAIKGTSRSKLHKELGLKSLMWRIFRCFCSFHKIVSTGLPTYLFNLIPKFTHDYQTRTLGNIPTYQCMTDIFKHSFFPLTITTWKKYIQRLKMHLLQFLRNTYNIKENLSCPSFGLQYLLS